VIRVLLADDENLIRTALASLLAIQDDLSTPNSPPTPSAPATARSPPAKPTSWNSPQAAPPSTKSPDARP